MPEFIDPDNDRCWLLAEPDQHPERVGFLTTRASSKGDLMALDWVYLYKEQVQVLVDSLIDWLEEQ